MALPSPSPSPSTSACPEALGDEYEVGCKEFWTDSTVQPGNTTDLENLGPACFPQTCVADLALFEIEAALCEATCVDDTCPDSKRVLISDFTFVFVLDTAPFSQTGGKLSFFSREACLSLLRWEYTGYNSTVDATQTAVDVPIAMELDEAFAPCNGDGNNRNFIESISIKIPTTLESDVALVLCLKVTATMMVFGREIKEFSAMISLYAGCLHMVHVAEKGIPPVILFSSLSII